MDNLLIFFALPVATILLAIVFQKILRNPILVGILAFAIYLIVTYTAFDSDFLIFAIAYTLLAYLTAVLTSLICRILRRVLGINSCNNEDDENNCESNCGCSNRSIEIETYSPQLVQGNEANVNDRQVNNNYSNNCLRYGRR